MKFVCYSAWTQLPDSAHALFAQAEKDSIFFSRQWFECLSTAVVEEDLSLTLACVVDDSKVFAILPLLISSAHIGYALKHRYTPRYSLLLAEEDQVQVLTCLAQGLSALPLKGLLLEPIADDDSRLNGLQQSMASVGYRCERTFRFYNWVLRVQGMSYADYLATRPANLRNTIARKQRKLARDHAYEIRLLSGDDVPQAMSDYYQVYTASWKANEQYSGLVDDMVAGFSRAGWCRLAILYIEGQPAAAQLWFVLHGKASIFRLAYDEAWRQYSLGSILTSFLMEHVIDRDKVTEIDFLTGNDAYKQDWMSERRERFVLLCVKDVKTVGRHKRISAWWKRVRSRQ